VEHRLFGLLDIHGISLVSSKMLVIADVNAEANSWKTSSIFFGQMLEGGIVCI
jgi:hypothetical protein